MKKVCSIVLALLLALTTAVPGYAAEGDVLPDLEQEETAPVQPPEDETVADEVPVLPDDPDETGDETSEEPVDPDEPSEGDGGEGPGDEDPAGEEPSDEELPEKGGEPEDLSELEDPEELLINVLIPASGQVVINPYQMSVATNTGETTEQIVHEVQELVNNSGFPVDVSVDVVGRFQPWSAARFVDAPPAEDGQEKEVFMYAEFQNDPEGWCGDYGEWRANQVLVREWNIWQSNVLTLDSYGVGYFRLFGSMTPFPAEMWTADDMMTVTLTFTFTPADESAVFSVETPDEPIDTILDDTPNDSFDDIQAVTAEPLPDTIPEPVPNQNSESTSKGTLEPELDAMDIFGPYGSIVPALNSKREVEYQLNAEA